MCKVKVASSSENTPFSQKTFVQGPDAPLHIRNNESTSYTHQSDRELPANPNMHLQSTNRIKNFLRLIQTYTLRAIWKDLMIVN